MNIDYVSKRQVFPRSTPVRPMIPGISMEYSQIVACDKER